MQISFQVIPNIMTWGFISIEFSYKREVIQTGQTNTTCFPLKRPFAFRHLLVCFLYFSLNMVSSVPAPPLLTIVPFTETVLVKGRKAFPDSALSPGYFLIVELL